MQEVLELRALISTLVLEEHLEPSTETQNPLALLSTINQDTMYYEQATQYDNDHGEQKY